MRFEYTVIQLNRLPWRRFLKQDNPVAAALVAKMKMRPKARPKVKAQCLRLLSTQQLDPEKSELIYVFFNSYLKLTAEETKVYDREVAGFAPEEREKEMELRSSWGIKGKHEGQEDIVTRLIRKRFGILPEDVAIRLAELPSEQLSELGEAFLDFTSMADLEQWLARHQPA